MDRSDILNTLVKCGSNENFYRNQSMSTARLQELGLKIGVVRKEQHNKDRSRLIYQHRTGTDI
uniref:Uncharacterized protein n=1 Tax=Arion vulgaris TaxID=1028688 RepID=A0A0B7BDF0_9EUPU